jgi:hypothetical protein
MHEGEKTMNQDNYKLNIAHSEKFNIVGKTINEKIIALAISQTQKDDLLRLIGNLVEISQQDSFLTGFKAATEFLTSQK